MVPDNEHLHLRQAVCIGQHALCGVAPFAANKCFAQARRLSDRFCAQAVLLCCEADRQMKTSYDDPARILELLILQLAEEARHD